ncbi:hypothetical protein INR77_13905 [Erythrobacter sp. SCSIO 43205]|uniref:hypothetical protein n=1 Tax=Erythrobacter sp. SCSIO 43205 TaxID=2779361 RepID=UPI001CAA4145|nr:hypothetical protein [Erythrobacter sp. SCSIO 43205]UAB77855.1 hypothetical protein INR77_13905 [Erythrobacter sp. SCSIO 43205]
MELPSDEFSGDISPILDVAELPREQLSALIAALASRFDDVGSSLGEAAQAFDEIIKALKDVVGAFDDGAMKEAEANIISAAEAMYAVPRHIELREYESARLPIASKQLRDLSSNVLRLLKMLRFYGVNIKIAASGEPKFIAFVDNIAAKLSNGEEVVSGFDEPLNRLEQSLETLSANDQSLARECGSVVPQVPEKLVADVEALGKYQYQLSKLAHATGEIAQAVQQEIGAAICAIQVGDRARQRLEHVLTGLEVIEASNVSDPDDAKKIRGHAMALLHALTEATQKEFEADLRSLLSAVHNLQPSSRQLTDFFASSTHNPDDADGGIFLRGLEKGIEQAARITERLDRADNHARSTMELIADIVADIAERAKVIGALRVEVQDMAINVSLQARQAGPAGPPIKVVANEIRDRSENLNKLVDAMGLVESELLDVATRMKEMVREGSTGVGGMLSRSLQTIRESAEQTEKSMKIASDVAGTIMPILQHATDLLESCQELSGEMDRIRNELTSEQPWCPEEAVTSSHLLENFLDTMGKIYTMADERAIHSQFLMPGMVQSATAAEVERPAQSEALDEFEEFDAFDDFGGEDGTANGDPSASTHDEDDSDLDDFFL